MADTEHRLRLKQIKLAGFKSFVDPTTVPFPSNLVGIVGPNGCGKSNVIDAVRWVMGESSAKNLRGESMADVIFNGSTSRKPISQASIDLVFTNPNGAIGGVYAEYSEIAIRRQVNRDGQSNYYLNGTRCRRKDIIDIFLGTGLGPRSYSIIGQGTVSRLIEARPEELRVYLEEAAGISKFKERRRETELRMQHTRDNLDRLNDIRDELDKQLNHLQRQAKAAEQYKELKEQERRYKAELMALRWQSYHEEAAKIDSLFRQEEISLEAAIAHMRKISAQIEIAREQFNDSHEEINQAQEQFYDTGAQVAKIEQSLQFQKERGQQLNQDRINIEKSQEEASAHLNQDKARVEVIQQEMGVIIPKIEALEASTELVDEKLSAAEEAISHWQQQWEQFNQKAAQASQTAQVQQTRIQHLEQTIKNNQQKIERLQQDEARLDSQSMRTEIHSLEEQQQITAMDYEKEIARLEEVKFSLEDERLGLQTLNKQLDGARGHLQKLRGRHASLEALQQAALGQDNSKMTTWLKQNNLADKARLAQCLEVEAGWEEAVETVLGNFLQAICIDDLDPVTAVIGSLLQGELIFCGLNKANHTPNALSNNPTLYQKIKGEGVSVDFLSHIYCVDNLIDALQLRATLASFESIITRDGIWIGPAWLRVTKSQDQNSGILKREQELKDLNQDMLQTQNLVVELEQQQQDVQTTIKTLDIEAQKHQQSVFTTNKKQSDLQAEIKVKQHRVEQIEARILQLKQEIGELQASSTQSEVNLKEVRDIWQEAMALMNEHADLRETLIQEKENTQGLYEAAKKQAHEIRTQLHQLSLQKQSLETEFTTKAQQQLRLQQQLDQFTERREIIQQAYEAAIEPIDSLQEKLSEKLEMRLVAEDALREVRRRVQNVEHELKDTEEQQEAAQNKINAIREGLEKFKMNKQALDVRCATILEQLQEEGHIVENVLKEVANDATQARWEEEIVALERRIQRLGAINLAAIDEYKEQSERKFYLDAQHEDLFKALNTLEEAVRKIDKETRQRFKETYDVVNQHFQVLFPKIFGGGSAYLEMTAEDLLDTGITVMARPPGKKNTTIHLLSGGEKALTAIALVFSIFQLNPAPFCMLDEVDAPLDDANVIRLCNLLKEMSKEVQFIFISHNKLAIEIAEHLTGVTMKEPGVSRIVSVDIDEAVAMATA